MAYVGFNVEFGIFRVNLRSKVTHNIDFFFISNPKISEYLFKEFVVCSLCQYQGHSWDENTLAAQKCSLHYSSQLNAIDGQRQTHLPMSKYQSIRTNTTNRKTRYKTPTAENVNRNCNSCGDSTNKAAHTQY